MGCSILTYTRQVCLPQAYSSYTFLTIILTIIFVFTKIQMLSYKCRRPLQAFQVSELQNPAYTLNYKHGCQGPTSKTVYRRQSSKSSRADDYTYTQTPYIERLAFPHFLRSICFFHLAMLQTHFCEICQRRESD